MHGESKILIKEPGDTDNYELSLLNARLSLQYFKLESNVRSTWYDLINSESIRRVVPNTHLRYCVLILHIFSRRSVTLYFFLGFCGFWPYCSCPNDLVTSIMAPAHPHATGVAVYPALLLWISVFFKDWWRAMIHVKWNFDSEKNEWGRVLENKLTILWPYLCVSFGNVLQHNLKTI